MITTRWVPVEWEAMANKSIPRRKYNHICFYFILFLLAVHRVVVTFGGRITVAHCGTHTMFLGVFCLLVRFGSSFWEGSGGRREREREKKEQKRYRKMLMKATWYSLLCHSFLLEFKLWHYVHYIFRSYNLSYSRNIINCFGGAWFTWKLRLWRPQ